MSYEIFPTDKNEGVLEVVDAISIQSILDSKKTIKDNLPDNHQRYFQSLGTFLNDISLFRINSSFHLYT